jgi:hypothetical protein
VPLDASADASKSSLTEDSINEIARIIQDSLKEGEENEDEETDGSNLAQLLGSVEHPEPQMVCMLMDKDTIVNILMYVL